MSELSRVWQRVQYEAGNLDEPIALRKVAIGGGEDLQLPSSKIMTQADFARWVQRAQPGDSITVDGFELTINQDGRVVISGQGSASVEDTGYSMPTSFGKSAGRSAPSFGSVLQNVYDRKSSRREI